MLPIVLQNSLSEATDLNVRTPLIRTSSYKAFRNNISVTGFLRFAKTLGLREATYTLQKPHSVETVLRDLGVPIEVISQILRHADIRVTAQHYAKSSTTQAPVAMAT
jgi:hypothetical protein